MTLNDVKAKLAAITGRRLVNAERAIAAGLAIITVPATGKRAVVVGSKSGHGSYVVTGRGCTCEGWTRRGYCAHSDAVYLMLADRAARKEAGATAPAASAEDYAAWCEQMGEAEQAQMRPVSAERQPSGDLHITDAETGRVVGIITSVQDDIDSLYGPAA